MKAVEKIRRSCLNCKKDIYLLPCRVKNGWGKYCSISCGSRGKQHNLKGNPIALKKFRLKFGVWNKGKPYAAIQGEKHWNWKGGVTRESLAIRTSSAYKKWRTTVFERDNFCCVLCGYKGNQLEADHIKSFSRFPELRLDINNGRTLCRSCHKTTPNYCGRVNQNYA